MLSLPHSRFSQQFLAPLSHPSFLSFPNLFFLLDPIYSRSLTLYFLFLFFFYLFEDECDRKTQSAPSTVVCFLRNAEIYCLTVNNFPPVHIYDMIFFYLSLPLFPLIFLHLPHSTLLLCFTVAFFPRLVDSLLVVVFDPWLYVPIWVPWYIAMYNKYVYRICIAKNR